MLTHFYYLIVKTLGSIGSRLERRVLQSVHNWKPNHKVLSFKVEKTWVTKVHAIFALFEIDEQHYFIPKNDLEDYCIVMAVLTEEQFKAHAGDIYKIPMIELYYQEHPTVLALQSFVGRAYWLVNPSRSNLKKKLIK